MKRILLLIGIISIMLLVACSGGEDDKADEPEVAEEETTVDTDEEGEEKEAEEEKKDTITKEEFKHYYGKLIDSYIKIMYIEDEDDMLAVFKGIGDNAEEVTEELKHEYKKDIDGVALLLSLGETFTKISIDGQDGYNKYREDAFDKMDAINTDYLESDVPDNLQKELDKASERIAQKEKEKVPREFKSALKKAQTYAKTMQMSKAGVHDQLVSEHGENFPEEAAQYAMDNIEFDWKENALKKAKTYAETMDMSDSGIYDQLVSEHGEKFTEEEAQYGIDNLD